MSSASDDEMESLAVSFGDLNKTDKRKQMDFIDFRLKAYTDLKLTAYEVYNSPRITKNQGWSEFKKTLDEFLSNKVSANKTHGSALHKPSFKSPSHKSTKPSVKPFAKKKPSAKPSAQLSTIASTSIEPIHMGGNKSRRNTHSRRNSKKQKHKRVRHTRRKQTRRHRHSRRR